MPAALETLASLPAKRKVAVLGDMLQSSKYTPEAHEAVGHMAAKDADVLFTGNAAAGEVHPRRPRAAHRQRNARGRYFSFDTADKACKPVQDFIKKGEPDTCERVARDADG